MEERAIQNALAAEAFAETLPEVRGWLFSRRKRFGEELQRIVRQRVQANVIWPDLLYVMTRQDIEAAMVACRPVENDSVVG